MFGLDIIDIAMIFAYFSAMIYIGWRSLKRIKNQEDYFLGGRRFGKFIQTFAAFGQGTSAESAVGITTMVHTNGISGVWAGLFSGLFGMPIYWLTTLWYRRLRLLTLADFFAERYRSRKIAAFYAVCQAIFFMIVAALGFLAMSKTVAAIAQKPVHELSIKEKQEYDLAVKLKDLESKDFLLLTDTEKQDMFSLREQSPKLEYSYINESILIIIVAVFVLFYAVGGGLEAAFVTDMIQGIFIILLTIILIPFGMMKINEICGTSGITGAFEAIHTKLPESFFELWGSPSNIEFTWFWILFYGILSFLNAGVQANQLTASGSAKDDETARFGFVTGIFIKRYATVIWGFVALITLTLYGTEVSNPDFVWGHATRDLLGHLGFGLVGLMIACLMAALMSTADCLMLTTSALLTENIYKPLFPGRTERHYVWAGRFFCLAYITGGILIATAFTSIITLLKLIFTFNCILAASFWLGMTWRRANLKAAWASMIVTFVITAFLPTVVPLFPGVKTNEYLMKTTISEPQKKTYTAREMDLVIRSGEIKEWTEKTDGGIQAGPRPQELVIGEKFEKTFIKPEKPVFWENIIYNNGSIYGSGMLNVDLIVLDKLGWDLSRNSYSLNETLKAILRLIIPFGLFIIVALFTKPQNRRSLDLFFAKMLTPVKPDRDEDAHEMELTRADPGRFNHLKLFPGSNWEFRRWDNKDIRGILWICLAIAGVFGLLIFFANFGG